jgi:hypothetical protein
VTDLSPEAKSLFGAARRELGPNADDRARVERRLGARLGAAVLTTSTLAAAGNAGSAATGLKLALPLLVKWLGVGLLVGGSVTSGYLLMRAPGGAAARDGGAPHAAPIAAASSTIAGVAPARADATSATTPAAPAPETTASPETLSNRAAALTSLAHANSAARSTPAEGTDTAPAASAHVGEETALMRRAHEALRAGDASRALSLLREHAVRFPSGILAEERSAELVSTLCQLGRKVEAEREAQRFLSQLPSSSLAPSVRASCAFAPATTEGR